MELILLGMMLFLILGSIVALELKSRLSAVIAMGLIGLGHSILFLLLGAPDIAITMVVVEVLIATVLIKTASMTRPKGTEEHPRGDLAGAFVASPSVSSCSA